MIQDVIGEIKRDMLFGDMADWDMLFVGDNCITR